MLRRLGGPMAAERGVHPALRKEDVAGLLDLLEAGRGSAGCTCTRRRPPAADGADTATRRAPMARAAGSRRRPATRRIDRARRDPTTAPARRTAAAPCDRDSACARSAARASPASPGTSRTASSWASAMKSVSASGQARHRLVAAPDARQPAQRSRRQRDVAQRREVRAFQAGASSPCRARRAAPARPAGARAVRSRVRREFPVGLLAGTTRIRCTFSSSVSRWQRGEREIEQAPRRQFARRAARPTA